MGGRCNFAHQTSSSPRPHLRQGRDGCAQARKSLISCFCDQRNTHRNMAHQSQSVTLDRSLGACGTNEGLPLPFRIRDTLCSSVTKVWPSERTTRTAHETEPSEQQQQQRRQSNRHKMLKALSCIIIISIKERVASVCVCVCLRVLLFVGGGL